MTDPDPTAEELPVPGVPGEQRGAAQPPDAGGAPPRRLTRGRVARALLTLVFVGGAATVLFSGAFGEPEETIATIRAAGPLGVLAYLALFSTVQPLGVSGHFFTLAAAAIWSPAAAFGLALVGALGSASVSFGFARFVAYDWVQARIPKRVRRLEKWLVERGLVGVVVFRFLTFTLPPAQLLIGTVRVRYPKMILGTAIGFAPTIAVDVFLGGELLDWLLQRAA